ncbi:MAG TPA: OmpH family outer membrane protein [Phycisphaerales bacterium]|nr:OmpH family outer membrane protein [Phycisphaerales bacterium]
MASMKNRWMALAGAAACVMVGAWAATRATASAPVPPAAPVVATIDLEEVIKGLKEREDKEKALSAKQGEYQGKLNQMTEDAKSEKSKIENMPDTPEKIAAAKNLREKLIRAEFEKQYAERLLGELKGEMMRELYVKISEATKSLAKRNGYQLVLSNDQNVPVGSGDPDAVLRAIALRRVMYAAPELDITSEVVTELNNLYAAGPTKR